MSRNETRRDVEKKLIATCRDEAGAAGNMAMVARCNAALMGLGPRSDWDQLVRMIRKLDKIAPAR